MKKVVLIILSLVAVATIATSATMAYLTTRTERVVNTFTYGDIQITLTEEHGGLFENCMPGDSIEKDPVVTVKGGSESCYLFVKYEKTSNFDSFMTFAIDSSWTPLDGRSDVYYKVVDSSDTDQLFYVLADNKVYVKTTVTKSMIDSIKENPSLSFIAYAVQQKNIDTVAAAWACISPSNN